LESEPIAAAAALGAHTVLMLGAVRKCISLLVVDDKSPSPSLAYLLVVVRPPSDRQPP